MIQRTALTREIKEGYKNVSNQSRRRIYMRSYVGIDWLGRRSILITKLGVGHFLYRK